MHDRFYLGCEALHLDLPHARLVSSLTSSSSCWPLTYHSHSRQLPQFQRAMWYLLGYIAIGFIVIEITYYGVFCRPFSQYWAMPVKNFQCATYQHYSILQMCFNITSDIALVAIPIPMVWSARLPLRRKLVLCFVFGMAGFTVLAAILNK